MQGAATVYGMDPAQNPATRMANRIVTEELSPTDVIESDAALAPPRLAASTERKPFDLRELKKAAEALFGASGELPDGKY